MSYLRNQITKSHHVRIRSTRVSVSSINLDNTIESNLRNTIESNLRNTIESNLRNTEETSKTSMGNPDVTCNNRFRELIRDDESDFSDVVQNNGIKITRYENREDNIVNRGENDVINTNSKNKTGKHSKPNHVPGNSAYSEMTKNGEKILILSDSICNPIEMKEINRWIKNGYAYRKSFPG